MKCRYSSHVTGGTGEVECPNNDSGCKEPCQWAVEQANERQKKSRNPNMETLRGCHAHTQEEADRINAEGAKA